MANPNVEKPPKKRVPWQYQVGPGILAESGTDLGMEEKVSGLFSGELSSDKTPGWEDPNVQTKRGGGFITP
ncbi:MAG: hypothetical protein RLY70_2900 [Planctomycetota bacterium]